MPGRNSEKIVSAGCSDDFLGVMCTCRHPLCIGAACGFANKNKIRAGFIAKRDEHGHKLGPHKCNSYSCAKALHSLWKMWLHATPTVCPVR